MNGYHDLPKFALNQNQICNTFLYPRIVNIMEGHSCFTLASAFFSSLLNLYNESFTKKCNLPASQTVCALSTKFWPFGQAHLALPPGIRRHKCEQWKLSWEQGSFSVVLYFKGCRTLTDRGLARLRAIVTGTPRPNLSCCSTAPVSRLTQ